MKGNGIRVCAWFVAAIILVTCIGFHRAAAIDAPKVETRKSAAPRPRAGSAPPSHPAATVSNRNAVAAKFGNLPLSFEPNVGQAPPSIDFISHASNYTLLLSSKQATVSAEQSTQSTDPFLSTLTPAELKHFEARKEYGAPRFRRPRKTVNVTVAFEGASPKAQPEPLDKLAGKSNYFVGNDSSRWHSGVPTYGRVRYTGMYPGIDLVYYGNRRQLEFDFVVSPGASPNAIALKIGGNQPLRVTRDGSLQIGSRQDAFVLQSPSIYQDILGKRQFVKGGFALLPDRRVAVRVGAYDGTKPLVVDPVLAYSTYVVGGSSDIYSVAVDSHGDAYVVGTTPSVSFPIVNGYSSVGNSNWLAYMAKLDPTGSTLLYSTYLGGSGSSAGDYGESVAADSAGNAYITGYTFSSDFPVVNAFQTSHNDPGGTNAFVARIDTTQSGTASLVYSTYLGGGSNSDAYGDFAFAVATDGNGLAYVTGETTSDTSVTPFPVTSTAYQSSLASVHGNAFLSVLDTNQSGSGSLVYSTYLGGDAGGYGDFGIAVTVDSGGNAYLTGQTISGTSGPFPTTSGAFQSSTPNDHGAPFVTEIATTQSGSASLVYSSYFGGSTTSSIGDCGEAITLDSTGKVYIAGDALSSDFPTTSGAYQTSNSTHGKGFVAKFDLTQSGTSSLVYSTFLGGTNGSGGDIALGIAADTSGNAYVVGAASSTDFPTTSGVFQSTDPNTSFAAFFTEINPDASSLIYSTYLGGSGSDNAIAVSLDPLANSYVAGITYSSDFPTYPSGAFQTTFTPSYSGFITKFALNANPGIVASESPQPNANGWNNSSVTVSFTCIPGAAPLSSCTSPDTLSTEGASQSVTGTAEDTSSNTATATATVNIDLTAPTLSVTSPSSSSTVGMPYVAISGTISDSLSGVGGVTCADAPATVTGTSFSCTVPLSSVSNSIVIAGSDVAGNTTSTTLSVTVSMSSPTSLTVTPPTPNMTIGGTQAFTAIDQTGTPRPDATWSISDTSIASFVSGSPNTLTGNAASTATLTATIGSVTGTTTVTVLSSAPSVGTVLWSAPTVSGYSAQQIAQSVPTANGPDLYSAETDSSNDILIRAFTADGRQLWQQAPLSGSTTTFTGITPDNAGGIVLNAVENPSTSPTRVLTDSNSITGATNWQYTSATDFSGSLAVAQSGGVEAVEYSGTYSPIYGYPGSSLIAIDGGTGEKTATFTIPPSSISEPVTCEAPIQQSWPSPSFGPIVDADGNTYVAYWLFTQTYDSDPSCTDPDSFTDAYSGGIYLLTVTSGGSSSAQLLQSVSASVSYSYDSSSGNYVSTCSGWIPTLAGLIPDGQGGVLAAWTNSSFDMCTVSGGNPPLSVADYSPQGLNSYQLPVYNVSQSYSLVLGEQGVAFAAATGPLWSSGYAANVVSFNVSSGDVLWNYTGSTGSNLSLTAATADGGIAINDSAQGLIQLDHSGSAGSPVSALGGTNYFSNGAWLGISSDPEPELIQGSLLYLASGFAVPGGNYGQGASREDVSVVWCAINSCSGMVDQNDNAAQNVTFSIRADDLPHNIFNFNTSQIALMKQSGVKALQAAFAPYNVSVDATGRQAIHTAYVVNEAAFDYCGWTPTLSQHVSIAYYPPHVEFAQNVISDTSGNPTAQLATAVGTGIGNTAAHEIAHQLVNEYSATYIVAGMGLHDDSENTYNSASCSDRAPWVFGSGPIHWGAAADQSLASIFGRK